MVAEKRHADEMCSRAGFIAPGQVQNDTKLRICF